MSFRTDVKNRLEKIEYALAQIKKSVEALSQKPPEVDRLEKQNKDLMDRFMSANWSQYVNQNPDRWPSPELNNQDKAPDEESLIGQEVDNYEGGSK